MELGHSFNVHAELASLLGAYKGRPLTPLVSAYGPACPRRIIQATPRLLPSGFGYSVPMPWSPWAVWPRSESHGALSPDVQHASLSVCCSPAVRPPRSFQCAGLDGTCATEYRATVLSSRAVGSRAFQSMLWHSRAQRCLYRDLSRFLRSAVATPLPPRRWHCPRG